MNHFDINTDWNYLYNAEVAWVLKFPEVCGAFYALSIHCFGFIRANRPAQ